MTFQHKPAPPGKSALRGQVARSVSEDVPTKAEILEDISEGYVFVMSGGKGRPIDEMHREIADELAREEIAENADLDL